ncbi:hypothetical protein BJX66DRAFT_22761 [Aspergillus keveii]|jgi:hypothetical protein|uniref:Secreted protein n=1 Tax=Aspergillus keveii TaxID=714993 RepID=A0ABR4GJI2_9EURO
MVMVIAIALLLFDSLSPSGVRLPGPFSRASFSARRVQSAWHVRQADSSLEGGFLSELKTTTRFHSFVNKDVHLNAG